MTVMQMLSALILKNRSRVHVTLDLLVMEELVMVSIRIIDNETQKNVYETPEMD